MCKLSLFACGALLLLAPDAVAGGVRIVRTAGDQNFSDIQPAVDAALNGDVLLVGAGSYGPFVVDGKSLTIVAVPGQVATVSGTVVIRNIPSSSAAVVSGLTIQAIGSGNGALLSMNPGHVRLIGCQVFAGVGSVFTNATPIGASVDFSARVVFVNCTVHGGRGVDDFQEYHNGGVGGDGLRGTSSSIALYGCTIEGGTGGDGDEDGGTGGAGCKLSNGQLLFASKSILRGGQGGQPFFGSCGHGGTGLLANGPVYNMDSQFVGGAPSCGTGYGAPVSGAVTTMTGARTFTAPPIGADTNAWTVQVTGVPGDRVWVLAADDPDFQMMPAQKGVACLPYSPASTAVARGIIPASGTLSLPVRLAQLFPSRAARNCYAQGLVQDSTGALVLGNPLHLVRLNAGVGPDCDGNGASDFVQVIENPSIDANHNLVPDACDSTGPLWYVQASAAPGGNGSSASPFQSIGQGIAAASAGHTVLVADGVYTGSGNRDLDFGGKALVVRSQNGPAACVIDCQNAGRAFVLHSGETSSAMVKGFWIQNGNSNSSPFMPGYGGGILAASCNPTIEHCSITGCTATYGGAIALWFSDTIIRECTLEWNTVVLTTSTEARGGGLLLFLGHPEVYGCWIDHNTSATHGGGVWMVDGRLSHCFVRGNSALYGGGMAIVGDGFLPTVDDVLIAGNSANSGGGILKYGSSDFVLANATIAGNQSPYAGAALSCTGGLYQGGITRLRNSIVRDNVSPNGLHTSVGYQATLDIDFSSFQGGPGSVQTSYPYTFTWGSGNLVADPLFVDPIGPDNDPLTAFDNDYHLSPASPCIDSGDNTAVLADVVDIDSDGNVAEPVPIDLDALNRFVDDPATADSGNGVPPIVDMGCHEHP